MSSCHITISYHMFFNLISSADLFFTPFRTNLFYSTLFLIDSIWSYWIRFYWMRFTILFSIVPHLNEWFVCICLFVCIFISMIKCFFSSFLFSFFLFSFLFLLSFLMNVFLTHRCTYTDTCTHTDTHIHINIWLYVSSYDSYVLLQKAVSEDRIRVIILSHIWFN